MTSIPYLVDTPRERDLLPLLSAHRLRQENLGKVLLDSQDLTPRGGGADVDHKDLLPLQLLDLGLWCGGMRCAV